MSRSLYPVRLPLGHPTRTAIVHLAGKGAKEAAAQCFSEPRLDFESQAGACQLELVNASKHLGTHAVFNASSQRAADGKAAYVPLKHCVFDSSTSLFAPTSKLPPRLSGQSGCTAPSPGPPCQHQHAAGSTLVSVPPLRLCARVVDFGGKPFRATTSRCFTRHLSVAASARFAGRRCLSRLITALVTLLHLEGSWDALVFQRLRWQQHVASESVLAADHDDFKCGEAQ